MEFKPKKISLLLMSLLASSSPWLTESALAADAMRAQVLTAARMRAGPALDKNTLAIMPQGEVIQILGLEGEWVKVRRLRAGHRITPRPWHLAVLATAALALGLRL